MDLKKEGMSKPRTQSRMGIIRTLNLCDECFERLRADQLHDLFLHFGVSDSDEQRWRSRSLR
jgi:hypothetical protein